MHPLVKIILEQQKFNLVYPSKTSTMYSANGHNDENF